MIPPDIASRIRPVAQDIPAPPQPATPAQKLADVLSEFSVGQRIMAEIQALLPNGAYRAVIGQREVTLALPFSAKPGDSLELEVADTDGKLTLAFVADRTASAETSTKGATTSVSTTLSPTGKLIGDLLEGIDQSGGRPKPAALNGNQPLVTRFPQNAGELVPILKDALSKSGMFYESHQAQWVDGKLSTTLLLQEPQGKFSKPINPTNSGVSPGDSSHIPPGVSSKTTESVSVRPLPPSMLQEAIGGSIATTESANESLLPEAISSAPLIDHPIPDAPISTEEVFVSVKDSEGDDKNSLSSSHSPSGTSSGLNSTKDDFSPVELTKAGGDFKTVETTTKPTSNAPVHPDLTPLVQQQLDALANQTYVWQGQIWPGQSMHWEISEDSGQRSRLQDEETSHWQTRLQLTLPNLGQMNAVLRLGPDNQLDIAVDTDNAATRERLAFSSQELRTALENAGLTLTSFSATHGSLTD